MTAVGGMSPAALSLLHAKIKKKGYIKMYNNPFTSSPNDPREQIQESTVVVSTERQTTHNTNDILVHLVLRLSRDTGNNADKNVINLGGDDYGISLYISPLDKVQALPAVKQIQSDEPDKPTSVIFPDYVTITHISRSLLRMIRSDGTARYKFTFAFRIDNDSVIYASLYVPVEKVVLNDKNCRVTLGNPDTDYICELSDGNSITLTAAEIDELYTKNREKYIAKLKERRQNRDTTTQ